MTRELVGASGPELNHVLSYDTNVANSDPSGLITIVSSPAPSNGTYRWKGTGDGVHGGGCVVSPKQTVTQRTYAAFLLPQLRVSGTLSSGDAFYILALDIGAANADIEMVILYQTASTFKIKFVNRASGTDVFSLTTTNAFATGVDHSVRATFDGHLWSIWVNGVQESTRAHYVKPSSGQILLQVQSGMATGQSFLVTQPRVYFYDTESERPGFPCGAARLDPNANTSESAYYSQVGACTVDDGTYANWDDYAAGGTPDDGTTFNCGNESLNGSETSSLSTWTIPSGQVVTGVVWRAWQRANIASKTVANWARLKYSGSLSEVAQPNISWSAWPSATGTPNARLNPVFYNGAPGGGALTQTVIDGLEAGHRVVSTNDANAEVSALAVEVFSETDDPVVITGSTETVRVAQDGEYDTTFLDIRYYADSHLITSAICQNGREEGGGVVYWRVEDGVTGNFVDGFVEPLAFSDQIIDPALGLKYIPNPAPPPTRTDNTIFFLG